MALLLHAITPPAEASDDAFVLVSVARVTAWAAERQVVGSYTKEDLLAHHRVVTDIFERVSACLPARFPTLFETSSSLREHLARRHAALERQLERVRHACELSVTAAWSPLEDENMELVTEPVTSGREYLLGRRRALHASEHRRLRAEQLANDIEGAIGADLLDIKKTLIPSPRVAVSLALLIPRHAVDHLKARIPQTQQGVRILVNGPWPAYSFASTEAEQGDG